MPYCEVGHGRGTPFKLWYELHGSGDVKVVFIAGLGAPGVSWQPTVDFFIKIPGIQAVTFDNRGVAHSEYPKSTYSTAAMAADALDLVKHLGWAKIHIVGHSMGGMIAQELALQDLDRVASLSLLCTHAGGRTAIVPAKGAYKFLRSALSKTTEERVNHLLDNCHSQTWLNAKSATDGTRTNRQVLAEQLILRAQEIPMQRLEGMRGHVRSALTHSISYARLRQLRESKVPILIVTGTDDNLVNPVNSYKMAEWLPEAKLVVYKGAGHVVMRECEQELNNELWNHMRAADPRLKQQQQQLQQQEAPLTPIDDSHQTAASAASSSSSLPNEEEDDDSKQQRQQQQAEEEPGDNKATATATADHDDNSNIAEHGVAVAESS